MTGDRYIYDTAQTSKLAEISLLSMGRGMGGLRSQESLVRAIRAYRCTQGSALPAFPSWCDLTPHHTLGFDGYLLWKALILASPAGVLEYFSDL